MRITRLLLALCASLVSVPVSAQSLQVSFVEADHGSYQGEGHVTAVWIENSSGGYVKTIRVWGRSRKRHLATWNQVRNSADAVDAVTAATLRDYSPQAAFTWNLRNYQGQAVALGDYRVRFETTRSNSGNPSYQATIPVTLGNDPVMSMMSMGGFAVTLRYTPAAAPPPVDAGMPMDASTPPRMDASTPPVMDASVPPRMDASVPPVMDASVPPVVMDAAVPPVMDSSIARPLDSGSPQSPDDWHNDQGGTLVGGCSASGSQLGFLSLLLGLALIRRRRS